MKNNNNNNRFKISSKLKINKKYLKFLIPVGAFLFLLITFLGSRIIPAMLANNVYNMSDLDGNLGSVKDGDIINYEINGYSKWRVLSVDKENGTVEVTSDSNVYDLTIEPNQTVDEYNALFQAEADRFNDGRYVINTRTIAKSDSLMFDTKGEYWLANVNENTLMTNKTGGHNASQIPFDDYIDSDKVYVVPYFEVIIPDGNSKPSNNYVLNFDFNGVSSWKYTSSTRRQLQSNNNHGDATGIRFEAMNPVPLYVTGYQNVNTAVNNYLKYFDNLGTAEVAANLKRNFEYSPYGDIVISKYGLSSNTNIFNNYPELFEGVDYIYYYSDNYVNHQCIEKKYYYECGNLPIIKLYSSGRYENIYAKYVPKKLTFGYRPVLTLKISDNEVGKSTNEKLQIGDNVKYDANGYRNWKVLSINKEAGTVDIISGGVVKNISLFGMDDYNNYEQILQREVDAYKNGENALSARAIKPDDVDLLVAMKDKVKSMYWFDDKIEVKMKNQANLQTSSKLSSNVETISFGVGIIWTDVGDYYVNNGITSSTGISKYWVKFYSKGNDSFQYYLGNGDASYIAGLRPIITLKYDAAKKLSTVQARKLDKSSQDYDKFYTNEQLNNNFTGSTAGLLFTGSGENIYNSDISYNGNNGNKHGDNSKSEYRKVDVDMGETTNVLHLAVILSIISGLLIVGSASFLAIYKYKYVNRD